VSATNQNFTHPSHRACTDVLQWGRKKVLFFPTVRLRDEMRRLNFTSSDVKRMLAILGECEVTVASQAALFKFFPEHSTLTEVGKKRWRAAVQDLRVLIDRIQPHLDGGGGDGGDGVGDDAHECELDTRTMRTHTLRARTHHAHMRPRPRNTSPPLPPIRGNIHIPRSKCTCSKIRIKIYAF